MTHLHVGPILRATGGRTDNTAIDVESGAYVLPSDVVSGMPGAEGNSLAGHKIIDGIFKPAPYGAWNKKAPYGSDEKGPYGSTKRADGGRASSVVPIMAAGGEHVLSPAQVANVGDGDIDAGHRILDTFVKKVRANNVKTLKKLPGPVKG